MRRFFVRGEQTQDNEARLSGSDAHHLRNVLRAKPGDRVVLVDDRRREHEAKIVAVSAEEVKLKLLATRPAVVEPVQFSLYQAVAKGEKMDWIVQKATELGVDEIVPTVTARTVVQLDEAAAEKRRTRWQRITAEAAKQAQRPAVPQVGAVTAWADVLDGLAGYDLILVPWEESKRPIEQVLRGFSGRSLAVLIGPEGGFEAAEVQALEGMGALAVTLGQLILRTETASVVALTLINHLLSRYQWNRR